MQRYDIGLIVWGCKGGHRVFCSRGVDYRIKSINDTIKDIRSFVRFNLINLTTYAVEFTDDYKVFTIYRSCNDSGTGAYVAITLYIPHTLRVLDLRKSLDSIMDFYFKEFVHPVFGTYYDGKYDSIDQYNSFMDKLQVVPEGELFEHKPSEQDDGPHLKIYEDISEVDEFFESPYRKEFFKCQEVMFMSRDLYNQSPESLRLNFKETVIEKVSEPEKLPQLYVGDNKEVAKLIINGKECPATGHHPVNIVADNVCIIMHRQYCEDLSLTGKILQLIDQGKLIEKNKTISIGNVSFEYRNYEVRFTLNSQNVPDDIIYIQEKGTQPLYPIREDRVIVPGNLLNREYDIFVKPCKNGTDRVLIVSSFLPEKIIESNTPVNVVVNMISFKVEVAYGVSDKFFYICLEGNIKLKIPIANVSSQCVNLYLPKKISLSSGNFDKANPETELSYGNNVLTITSKKLSFEVIIPNDIKSLIQDWDFCISTESRKNTVFFKPGFKIKIKSDEDINRGNLYINGQRYLFEESEGRIYPLILFVKLKDSDKQFFSYKLNENSPSMNEVENRIFPLSDIELEYVIIDNELYKKTKSTDHNIVSIELSRVQSSKPLDIIQNAKISLKFHGCKGLYIQTSEKQIPIKEDSETKSFGSLSLTIVNEKGESLCTVRKDVQKYNQEESTKNKKNGFVISYDDNSNVSVQYKKPKNNLVKLFRNKFFLSVSALLLIVFCAGMAWMYLKPEPAISLMRIYISVADDPDTFGEKINNIEINGTKLLRYGCSNDSCYIDVIWNKESAEHKVYSQLLGRDLYASFTEDSVPFRLSDIDSSILERILRRIKDVSKNYEAKNTMVKINSPIQIKLKKIEDSINPKDPLESVFEKYNTVLSNTKNEKVVKYILKVAYSKLDVKNLEECGSFLKIFEKQKNSDVYKEVEGITTQLKEALALEQKLMGIIASKKTLLHAIECNIDTVKKVEIWWGDLTKEQKEQILEKYNFPRAIEGYKKFFNATNCGQIQELDNYESCFSTDQYKVIKYADGYRKNRATFNHWKKDMGMSFSKPFLLIDKSK